MSTLPDRIVKDATETAFGILDLVRTTGGDVPEAVPDVYARLLDLTTMHGARALGLVWLIWGRTISLGLDESATPDTAVFAEMDGDPDLAYVRRAVILARQQDGEGMAELVDAVVRDQKSRRTGASVEVICAFLTMGAVKYAKPTKHDSTHHE
jgi:hypothetical protein